MNHLLEQTHHRMIDADRATRQSIRDYRSAGGGFNEKSK